METKVSAPQLLNALNRCRDLSSYISRKREKGLGNEKEALVKFIDKTVACLVELRKSLEVYYPEAKSIIEKYVKTLSDEKIQIEKKFWYRGRKEKSYKRVMENISVLQYTLNEMCKILEKFKQNYPNFPETLLTEEIKNVEEKVQFLSQEVKTTGSVLKKSELELFQVLDKQESRIEKEFDEIKKSLEGYSTRLSQLKPLMDLVNFEELHKLEVSLRGLEEKTETSRTKAIEMVSRPEIYDEVRKEISELRKKVEHMENYLKNLTRPSPEKPRYIPQKDLERLENEVFEIQKLVSQRSISTVGQVKEGLERITEKLERYGFVEYAEIAKELYKTSLNFEEKTRLDEKSMSKFVDNTGKLCTYVLRSTKDLRKELKF